MVSTLIPRLIEKESISELSFPSDEVLKNPEHIQQRRRDIDRAVSLGNLEKGKVKILFEDLEGLKQVETTLWGATELRIILKQGRVIPIHRIHRIIV